MNIAKMLQQAKKMQSEMTKKLAEHDAKEYTFSFQNDLVTIKIFGSLKIKEIIIKEDLVDKDDIDTLQDVITEATNNAIQQVLKDKEEISKGMMPAGMPGF